MSEDHNLDVRPERIDGSEVRWPLDGDTYVTVRRGETVWQAILRELRKADRCPLCDHDFELRCADLSPDGYLCTRYSGHKGDHVVCLDRGHDAYRWSTIETPPPLPAAPSLHPLLRPPALTMTLREWYAGEFMGIVHSQDDPAALAAQAVRSADALIAALKRTPEPE